MTGQALFAALEPVHQLAGRVRFRYRRGAGSAFDGRAATAVIKGLTGVHAARLNPAAHSLVVEFDPALTDAARLAAALVALTLATDTPAPANASPPAGASKSAGTSKPAGANQSAGTSRPAGASLPVAASKPAGGAELAAVVRSGALLLVGSALPLPLKLPLTLTMSLPLFGAAAADLRRAGVTSHVLEALAVAISAARRDFVAAHVTLHMLALGEYLEHSIARRSDDLLKHLLRPDTGLVWVEENGVERQVAAGDVTVGATVIVGAGATIPIDGTVLDGEAMVSEAAMTGESAAVRRTRGDAALSGTVIEEGRLRIYAENVGRHTAAARIADYVERSLTAKSQVQIRASGLADRLVPLVLGLAGTAWLGSGDWQRVAAVLQADFSCALKLATPVAFKSSMYRAGQSGVLFKGADVVERLAEVDTVIFDKTGTLTSGQLAVTDSVAFDKAYSAQDLLNLAASVEEHYFHPLAQAVVEAARAGRNRHFDHKEVEFIAAHGVASLIDGRRIVVGSRHFVEEDEGVAVGRHRRRIDSLYRQGKTLLYIGYDGRLLGVIALKDTLRPNAAATVARLRTLGVRRVLMLTGDHHDRAAELAQQLGLDAFHAELLPEQKAEIVQRLAADGARIAFVGDGINDAPALAGAHVGIAMQRGADIARLTSDIALLEDDIGRVADAKALADATMQRIDSNFRLAMTANSGILAGAAAGALTPVASSVLHNGSTIAILLNALRGGTTTSGRTAGR